MRRSGWMVSDPEVIQMGTERISTGKSACDVQSLLVTVPTNDVTDTFSFRNASK